MQKDMDFHCHPGAKDEFMDLRKELKLEVPLSVPANEGKKSVIVSVPENANSFLAQRGNLFPMGGLE